MNRIATYLLSLLVVVLSLPVSAQNDEINRRAREWGKIGTAAFYGKALIVTNLPGTQYAASNMPQDCMAAIAEIYAEGGLLKDVVLTAGGWVLLYGYPGQERTNLRWANIPEALVEKINTYCNAGEVVYNIAVNDQNEWAIITDKHYSIFSDMIDIQTISNYVSKYGNLSYVYFYGDAKIFCFRRGCVWFTIEDNVGKAINGFSPRVWSKIKCEGTRYFIVDRNGDYSSNIIGGPEVAEVAVAQVDTPYSAPTVPVPTANPAPSGRLCPECYGLGFTWCMECFATGRRISRNPQVQSTEPCRSCNGQPRKVCTHCGGTGRVAQ